MKMNQNLMNLTQFAVEQAKKYGANSAEAFISDSQGVDIEVNNREIEKLNAFFKTLQLKPTIRICSIFRNRDIIFYHREEARKNIVALVRIGDSDNIRGQQVFCKLLHPQLILAGNMRISTAPWRKHGRPIVIKPFS